MNSETSIVPGAIRVAGLCKSFTHYAGSWGRLADWLGLATSRKTEHRVLEEIGFAIEPGSAIGIIGRNGAGKSTLLKLLTGTLEPSAGSVRTGGRIAALLELGMGFHPELSGRQNAYIAGALQGIGEAEMTRLMPEIAAFAEIGEAFDQPLRTYSSGMHVRLAFSVATVHRPDILIVDEALSVGDAYFQHKCIRRIRHYLADGVTLLFVSHDPLSIKTLCDRALLIERGRIALDDTPIAVLDYYNAMIAAEDQIADAGERAAIQQQDGQTTSGNLRARIVDIALLAGGRPVADVLFGADVVFRIRYRIDEAIEDITAGILIRDRLGNEIYGINTTMMEIELPAGPVGHEQIVDFRIPALNLGPGHYNLSVALHRATSHLAGNYDWRDQAITFCVGPNGRGFAGVAGLPCEVALTTAT